MLNKEIVSSAADAAAIKHESLNKKLISREPADGREKFEQQAKQFNQLLDQYDALAPLPAGKGTAAQQKKFDKFYNSLPAGVKDRAQSLGVDDAEGRAMVREILKKPYAKDVLIRQLQSYEENNSIGEKAEPVEKSRVKKGRLPMAEQAPPAVEKIDRGHELNDLVGRDVVDAMVEQGMPAAAAEKMANKFLADQSVEMPVAKNKSLVKEVENQIVKIEDLPEPAVKKIVRAAAGLKPEPGVESTPTVRTKNKLENQRVKKQPAAEKLATIDTVEKVINWLQTDGVPHNDRLVQEIIKNSVNPPAKLADNIFRAMHVDVKDLSEKEKASALKLCADREDCAALYYGYLLSADKELDKKLAVNQRGRVQPDSVNKSTKKAGFWAKLFGRK